jgi:DNA-binding SARP family transcriptional activator
MTVRPEEQRIPSRFTLSLLGGFALHREGRTMTATPAAQRLLAYVATRTKAVNRVATARALWPDSSDTRAAANLRSTLWRLRQDHGGGPIRSTPHGLELAPSTTVDIHAVHQQTAALTSVPDRGCDLDPGVLRHDVLPDWTDEWLLTTREWFRQIRLHALETLCARHCRYGRFDAALEAGMAAVDCEPLRESAHRAIVRVHLAEGNPAEALRQYDLYRRLADSELGLRPSQQFRALVSHLLGRPLDARPR